MPRCPPPPPVPRTLKRLFLFAKPDPLALTPAAPPPPPLPLHLYPDPNSSLFLWPSVEHNNYSEHLAVGQYAWRLTQQAPRARGTGNTLSLHSLTETWVFWALGSLSCQTHAARVDRSGSSEGSLAGALVRNTLQCRVRHVGGPQCRSPRLAVFGWGFAFCDVALAQHLGRNVVYQKNRWHSPRPTDWCCVLPARGLVEGKAGGGRGG